METSENKPKAQYTGNSHKSREDRAKLQQVTSSRGVTRKKPLGSRISAALTGDDAKSVGEYILMDVLVPAVKSLIFEVTSQGAERMLWGDSSGRSRTPSQGRSGFTPYNQIRSTPGGQVRDISRQARNAHNFDEVVLPTRAEAEMVLNGMYEVLEQYDIVTVAELYNLTGITGSYTDEKYGWNDLRGATAKRVREGYVLVLPTPIEV